MMNDREGRMKEDVLEALEQDARQTLDESIYAEYEEVTHKDRADEHASDMLSQLIPELRKERERAARMEGALRELMEVVGWIDYLAADDGNKLSAVALERVKRAKAKLDSRRREGER